MSGTPPPSTIPRRPTPLTSNGTPGPGFTQPNWAYDIGYHEPQCRVRIWRISDGKEWLVSDTFGVHRVEEYVTSISTTHSIGDAAGQFSVSLLPSRFQIVDPTKSKAEESKKLTRTWGDILKPMDYVEVTLAASRKYWLSKDEEIRKLMAETETLQSLACPYVVLRGFITNVRVVDSIDGQTGQPRRRVMVNGMNFGKLWLTFRMYLLAEENEMYMNKYGKLFMADSLTPADLMGILYGAVFRPQLNNLGVQLKAVLNHKIYCDVPSDGRYRITGSSVVAAQSQGPLDSILRQYAAKPYTEFFTYDEPWPSGSPVTIWRWAPLLNRANRFPNPDHIPTKPKVNILHVPQITEHDIGNSDSDVLTYYHAAVAQQLGVMTEMQGSKVIAPGYLDYPKFLVYGFQPYEPPWPFYPTTPGNDPAQQSTGDLWANQCMALTSWLASVFEHNPDNMEGQISCHGRPDIQCGSYLDVPETGYRFYIEGVSHNFVVGSGFTTTLTVTRGLPLRDLPNWVLPPGYEFDPTGSGTTNKPVTGANSIPGTYTAPASNDPNGKQPVPPDGKVEPGGDSTNRH